MVARYLKRFKFAIRGLVHAAMNDFGYRSQLYLGLAVGIGIAVFLQPITAVEFLFILLAWTLILITELQNTALEVALDKLHPELHDQIGISKDLAAGAVLTAGLFLVAVLVVVWMF